MNGAIGNHSFEVHCQRQRCLGRALLCAASALAVGWSVPAMAQSSPQNRSGYSDSEIIVTARKREESILKVPVLVTALSNETLENTQVTQVTDLPRLVPGLVIAGNLLSIGPQVTIRGVGTSSFDPGVDQSVSLNIDGLSLGQGLAFGSAMVDVGQVEVLKGPQALFYGKSSPGGVISLRTADPTDETEVMFRGGYEFAAREMRGEAVISGPVSDTLGARFASMYSSSDGFFRNIAVPQPGTGALAPRNKRDPQTERYLLRGTLLWEPSDSFSARLKFNHVYDRAINAETQQLAGCPDGLDEAYVPFPPLAPVNFIGVDECKVNRDLALVYMDPASFPGIPNEGVPYLQNRQNFGTLELNYDLTPDLTLTSTTAYYKLVSSSSVNPTHTAGAAPTFAVTNNFRRREFTQELRLNSDYSGPLNFTLGGFFEDGQLYDRVRFIRNTSYVWISPAVVGADILNDHRATTIDIKTYSIFGQLRYKLIEQLELAAGVRWNDETRTESVYDFQNDLDITSTLPRPKVSSSNFSPEFTATYTQTDDLTIFASYKKGFKSGSFKVAVPAQPGENNAFDDERVRGYEIGLKSRLLDRSLLLNLAFYDYYYKGLQVGGIEDSEGGVPIIRTVNAGKARTYGVDFDVAYRPPSVDGLSLTGSVNWNKARYTLLDNIPCYANQVISQGCNLSPNPTSIDPETGLAHFTAQDLSGSQMIRAPEWAVNFGFDYELPVGSNMKVRLSNNNQYSAKYPTFLAVGRPDNDNIQSGYFRTDASIAMMAEDESWEVALIGKNLSDKVVTSNCAPTNFAGGIILPFGGANTGGTTPGAMGWAEKVCYPDGPGRTIWVRLTLRPSKR